MSPGLDRVRQAARRDKKMRFTARLHHVTPELLEQSYYALKRQAVPGLDGVTWAEYGKRRQERLAGLHERVHRGRYRAQPSKRAYLEKEDGRPRSLGFSYGFRPGRSQHEALDALWMGLMTRAVNGVWAAEVSGFFETIDHDGLRRMIQHRIGDRRILRRIRKGLRAGVSEEGQWSPGTQGTPQGAVISPWLANSYLH